MPSNYRRKKWEDLATLVGKTVRIKSARRLGPSTYVTTIDSIVIGPDSRGRIQLLADVPPIAGRGRGLDNIRVPLDDVTFISPPREEKNEQEKVSSLHRTLVEKILRGDAELITRKHNISAWRVRPRASAAPLTVLFNDDKKIVVNVK